MQLNVKVLMITITLFFRYNPQHQVTDYSRKERIPLIILEILMTTREKKLLCYGVCNDYFHLNDEKEIFIVLNSKLKDSSQIAF